MGLGDAMETVSGFSVSKSRKWLYLYQPDGSGQDTWSMGRTHGFASSFLPSFLLWPLEDHHFGQIKVCLTKNHHQP